MNTIARNLFVNFISSNPCSAIARTVFGYGIPIFMMHRMRTSGDTLSLSATSDEHLRRCLDYLRKKHYQFISIRDLVTALSNRQSLPKKCAVFTMDDGYEDQARVAAPVFHEFDCPATIFLITGLLDRQLWPWDDQVAYLINATKVVSFDITIGENQFSFQLSSATEKKQARRKIQNAIKSVPFGQLNSILSTLESATDTPLPTTPPDDYKALTWDEVRQYEKMGIEFGPHTVSHHILSRIDADSMHREIQESWNRTQAELANPSPIFCYPTGRYCDFGTREIKFVRESGFIGAVSTIAAQVRPEHFNQYYQYALPRFSLPDSLYDFKLYCSWFEYVRERNLRYWPK